MRSEEEVKERLSIYMANMYSALAKDDFPNAERSLTMANLMSWTLGESPPATEITNSRPDRKNAGTGDPPQTTIRCGNGETPFYGDILIR